MPDATYSAVEMARIEAARLPVRGKLDEHPVMIVGGRRYRPICFPEEIIN